MDMSHSCTWHCLPTSVCEHWQALARILLKWSFRAWNFRIEVNHKLNLSYLCKCGLANRGHLCTSLEEISNSHEGATAASVKALKQFGFRLCASDSFALLILLVKPTPFPSGSDHERQVGRSHEAVASRYRGPEPQSMVIPPITTSHVVWAYRMSCEVVCMENNEEYQTYRLIITIYNHL